MPGAFSAATAIRFGMVGVDGNGRASIEWGVYGVPETFVVGRDGAIAYKMVGPVTPQNFESVLKAEIDKALKAGTNSDLILRSGALGRVSKDAAGARGAHPSRRRARARLPQDDGVAK